MYRRLNPGDDPDVAMAWYTLGSIREALGRYAEAVPLYESGMEMSRRLWPPTHRNVLGIQERLATACYYLERYDRAIQLFETVLKVQRIRQGPRHPATLMTMANLGANLIGAGRASEALPLLEAVWKESEGVPGLSGLAGPHLLAAYGATTDPADVNGVARLRDKVPEILARLRGVTPEATLASILTTAGQSLNRLRAWDSAEPLLREAFTSRQKREPDAWTTFSTMSVLGETLLGRNRIAEAEPLLLDGYRGLKQREAAIPPQGRMRVPEALERLVRLYEATGNAPEAATWRKALEAARKGAPGADRNR